VPRPILPDTDLIILYQRPVVQRAGHLLALKTIGGRPDAEERLRRYRLLISRGTVLLGGNGLRVHRKRAAAYRSKLKEESR